MIGGIYDVETVHRKTFHHFRAILPSDIYDVVIVLYAVAEDATFFGLPAIKPRFKFFHILKNTTNF